MNRTELILQEAARCPVVHGVSIIHIMALPDSLRLLLQKMLRFGPMTVGQVASSLEIDRRSAGECVMLLVARGYLEETHKGESGSASVLRFRVALAPMRGKPIPEDL